MEAPVTCQSYKKRRTDGMDCVDASGHIGKDALSSCLVSMSLGAGVVSPKQRKRDSSSIFGCKLAFKHDSDN